MLLSEADVEVLKRAGHDRSKFARFDRDGFVRLRNHRGFCVFYEIEKCRCGIYDIRPLGCRIYPVIYSEREGVLVDDLCPMKETVVKKELREKGESVIALLRRIDRETCSRRKS